MAVRIGVRHAKKRDGSMYCASGIEAYLDRHGIDKSAFYGAGIPMDELAHINDLFMVAMRKLALEEQKGQRNGQ